MPQATHKSLLALAPVYLILGFFDPTTLFRASFLYKFASGDNVVTTMSVKYSSKILSKAFLKSLP